MTEKKDKEMKHGIDFLVRDAIERLVAADRTPDEAAAAAKSRPVEKKRPNRHKKTDGVASADVKEVKSADSKKKNEQKRKRVSSSKEKGVGEKPAGSDTNLKKKSKAASESPSSSVRTEKSKKAQPAAEKVKGGKKTATPAPSGRAIAKQKRKSTRSIPVTSEVQPLTIFAGNQLASASQKESVIVKRDRNVSHDLRVIPLGGLGEVGKNMMLIEYKDDIIVVDCGLSFPGDGMFGIDLVIPDYSYLLKNKDKVRAFLLTHGHEDHIGAMPYVLRDIDAPVYGSPLTIGLLKGKLTEHQVTADLHTVSPREEVDINPFRVEFIRLTHSIPDSMGLAIHTPLGTILFISDFKMDMSPIDGQLMDFGRISAFGEKGVLLLMSDSTNVEKDGFSNSERSVGINLEKHFMNAEGRIIVTSFASHVHRAQQVLRAAQRTGRKVAVVGRGMVNMFSIAGQMGYLNIPQGIIVDISEIDNYPASKIVVITTGSQGEPMSGLTRMASGEHRQVQIRPGDTVVISANPIPGNELTVSKTVDNLFRLGANVIYERNQGIHVSGHASREELKVLLNMVKPRFFLPVHGEYRMLHKHAILAQELGMAPENTIVIENGQVLEINRRHCRVSGVVPHGRTLIDGFGVGDVGAAVLKERRQLSEGGVIVLNMVYTKRDNGKIICGPEIYSRGFIFEKEYEHIISEMKAKVMTLCTPERLTDGSLHDLHNLLKNNLGRFVLERTGRRPVIMTLINEV